jgi:hypothetical protein
MEYAKKADARVFESEFIYTMSCEETPSILYVLTLEF